MKLGISEALNRGMELRAVGRVGITSALTSAKQEQENLGKCGVNAQQLIRSCFDSCLCSTNNMVL